MQRIKSAVKYIWAKMPVIILAAIVIILVVLGIESASGKISDAYYNTQIAPFISTVSLIK